MTWLANSFQGHRGRPGHRGGSQPKNSLSRVVSLKPQMVEAAQRVYDAWQQDAEGIDEVYGGGGICQDIADAIAGVLNDADIEAAPVSQAIDEQHVYVVAKLHEGVYRIDIPPEVYESGSGYSWKKREGVRLATHHIYAARLDPDHRNFSDYLDNRRTTGPLMTPEQFAEYGQGNAYLLLPKGAHDLQSDGVVSVIDDDAIKSVLDSFDPSTELLVDQNHGAIRGGSSESMGWITNLFADERGVWAVIHWTDIGREAILSGRYRYLSAYCETEDLGEGITQPVKIESATLTNIPGLPLGPIIDFTTDEPEPELVPSYIQNPSFENREEDDYLRGDCVLISNRGQQQQRDIEEANRRADAQMLHDISVSEIPGLNYHTELCRRLKLDPETADEDAIKEALDKRHHAPRISRRQVSNRISGSEVDGELDIRLELVAALGLPVLDATDEEIMQAIAYWSKFAINNRGSSIRMNTKTVNEPFAGPVKYSPESVYSERPKPRLNWDTWRSGFPSFQFPEITDQMKLDELCQRLTKGKTPQQMRALGNQYQSDFYMRSKLYRMADEAEQRGRLKNRQRQHRPLGFTTRSWRTLVNRTS